ncbi:Serine/threonine-protein kinase tel1 [Coemansia biformis]|uniref:Serine/threonine-protein kinase Tel1 n=1 Tax=Coemansia biformis TaxID=1286918 RepID=A0A9W8D216_9FUNG|nr:Serine/threonine-protein kinase tel1 [Coemansia biformis]
MTGPRRSRRIGVVPSEELAGDGAADAFHAAPAQSPIASQLRLIESTKATERARGVQELAELLREDVAGRNTLAASTHASVWESVLSWTAGMLIKEAQNFVNKHGEEWPHLSPAAERLGSRIQTQYAGHIRHIWIIAMPYLSTKLARFLTKHIADSLATDPCLTAVFGPDYAKVLRAWAAHEPHVYNCKDSRARAIADLCIRNLSRFGGAPDSQASNVSTPALSAQPGDIELTGTLLAVVTAATPARLAGMSEAVLNFCAEYCRFHTRESPCLATILDTANTVLLARADTQLAGGMERVRSMLSSILQLWTTRSAHLKRAVLYSIRILTRLVAHQVAETNDPDARALLELALKTLTSGAWDRHKFMSLPRELLGIFPLVHSSRRATPAIVPLQMFSPLHMAVDPRQLAFFDTVAYLAALLTRLPPRVGNEAAPHRKRRKHALPTSLSRLLMEIGSGDSPAKSRGTAQAVWYIANIYPDMLGEEKCVELLGDIRSAIQSSDMSQRGDLAEWILGTLRVLLPWEASRADAASPEAFADAWQHAVAGTKAGLSGAAGLAFDLLHQLPSPAADAHLLCRQAAGALSARAAAHDADSVRLLLFVAQYMQPGSGDEALARVLPDSLCNSPAARYAPANRTVLGPEWCTELRFTHVLHALAALADCTATCTELLGYHMRPREALGAPALASAKQPGPARVVSNTSPTQWHLVCVHMLRFIEQVTSYEHGQIAVAAMPYVSHVLWRISEHLLVAGDGGDCGSGDNPLRLARRVADGFAERFHAFVAESKRPELIWQTMAFISPWTGAYARIAALGDQVDKLLAALFSSEDAQLLCDLAMGHPGSQYPGAIFSGVGSESGNGGEAQVLANTPIPGQSLAAADGMGLPRHRAMLEARMLCTAAGMQHQEPWTDIVSVISALLEHKADLLPAVAARVASAASRLDDAQFLVASELILRCALLGTPPSSLRDQTLGKLKNRVLAFLDNEDYIGHMPTLFAVLRAMTMLLAASAEHQALRGDEDIPRFVAWLDADARQGRIDPFIEVEFARSVLGPWSRGESRALEDALSALDASPTETLLHRAQGSMSFVARMVAEEQLAWRGLRSPYLQPNGALVYPEAPELGVDEALVLMTRDFGLALLVSDSNCLVPGALSILLHQLDPQSGCPPQVVRLCRRLLSSIGSLFGFASVAQLVSACTADILAIEPGMYDTLNGMQQQQQQQPVVEDGWRRRAGAAFEHMRLGELERAREVLSGVESMAGDGEWACWLHANLLVLSVDNPELCARIGRDVLEPRFSAAQLATTIDGWPERVVQQLLMLYRPEENLDAELASTLAGLRSSNRTMQVSATYIDGCRQDPGLQQVLLPQWGRRYGARQIREAMKAMLGEQWAGDIHAFLTSPRVSWLVLHIESQLQAACYDDQRLRLACSLCLLATLAPTDVLDSPLVQSVFLRALVDNWLCGRERTSTLCCLSVAMLLDCSLSTPMGKLVGDVCVGLSTTLIAMLPKLPPQGSAGAARVLAHLLHAVSQQQGAGAQDDSRKLFVGSKLDCLYDWTLLPQAVITRSEVQRSDDRLMLSRIAENAARLLDCTQYTPVCAEFLAAAVERILQLALPQVSDHSDESIPDIDGGGSARVDLAASVTGALLRVRHAVTRHLRTSSAGGSGNDRCGQATTLLLLRTVSALQMLDEPDTGDATSAEDKERLAKEGDLCWLVCNSIAKSHEQDAIMAAIRVAAELNRNAGLGDGAMKRLDPQQRWILRDVLQMPAVAIDVRQYPEWMQRLEPPALDSALLESMCAHPRTAGSVISELVCALAVRDECRRIHAALPLIWADARVAGCLLPHVIHEILPRASAATRGDIAAFVLDVSHNWHARAPDMVQEVIARVLEARQLDERYTDVREFLRLLPLALFEVADLAAKLDMPETTAFLLECDLTCTDAERAVSTAGISVEARALLRTVYQRLGNQPAAQLLGSVGTAGDVLRRCQDTADWRTLLLYQEAAAGWQQGRPGEDAQNVQLCGGSGDGCEIGDTLVNLGLLHSIRPGMGEGARSEGIWAGTHGGSSQAAYAASWRLARWDVPVLPLACAAGAKHLGGGFVAPIGHLEESLYSMFKLRSRGQPREAALAVQECMASPRAIAALTARISRPRPLWPFYAIGALLPLVAGNVHGALGQQEFVQASRAAALLLARHSNLLGVEALEPMHLANLTLHEIAVHGAMVQDRDGSLVAPVFSRYREAVRAACIASRRARSWQTSMSHIFRLRATMRVAGLGGRTLEYELKLWEAETLWDAGNRGLAIEILQSHKAEIESALRSHGVAGAGGETGARTGAVSGTPWTPAETEAATILLSRVILTVGEWSDSQRSERPTVLWEEYFNKAARLLENARSSPAWTGRVLHGLAAFAERQCEELTATRDDETVIAMRKQKSREFSACQQLISRTTSTSELGRLKVMLRRLEIQVANDQKELAALRSSIDGFLRLAIWSFVKCLECTDAFDDSVYSLVSLVVTHARSTELQSVLEPGLTDGVPSRKFLPLVHQLCARLSTEEDSFHQTMVRLVRRMAVDYPYHTMYHLFALRNANRTSPAASASKLGRRSASLAALQAPEGERMEERRSEAATEILVSVSSVSPDLKSIVQAMDELCSMYIELAVSPVPEKYKNGNYGDKLIAFDRRLRIGRLTKSLPPNVPVLTARPQADVPRDYMCVPFVSNITDGYLLAGGINLPKITRVLGTDGQHYKQLVKGKDDMRQDAIIEQLFRVINCFVRAPRGRAAGLGAPPASGLRVRTYQVVPLTKRCGVLQWVDDTVPLGSWFRASDQKYRPEAPTMKQLRTIIHDVHGTSTTVREKLEVFERVCGLAPPIFRFFFSEHFYNAQSWFERREAYIRSAAVASIAGWVLGVGDRHLQNILVDQTTAEVVHIDLGIAFDLGKLLPIPELVPFRLTREMIDGMGILGLDGTFRHTCQAALQALRANARVVITILNVLKVDPLYMWSLIPLRQDKINRNVSAYVGDPRDGARAPATPGADSDSLDGYVDEETSAAAAQEENKEAGRSIQHVGQRLSAAISVEGQVSELIQQATDPGLLSRMFEGWSAWY